MPEFNTLQQIVEQLELCGFKDEVGHELKMNKAFISLKEKAEQSPMLDVKSILKLIHERIPLEKGNHNFQIDAEDGELVLWILIGEKWQSILFDKDDGEKPANLLVDGIIESLINAEYKI